MARLVMPYKIVGILCITKSFSSSSLVVLVQLGTQQGVSVDTDNPLLLRLQIGGSIVFQTFHFLRRINNWRLICAIATEPLQKQAEESKMEAPKEIFLKDLKEKVTIFLVRLLI
nr:puromycin-sensitive aminopeptidase isoform X1 [Ipomoea batatas]